MAVTIQSESHFTSHLETWSAFKAINIIRAEIGAMRRLAFSPGEQPGSAISLHEVVHSSSYLYSGSN